MATISDTRSHSQQPHARHDPAPPAKPALRVNPRLNHATARLSGILLVACIAMSACSSRAPIEPAKPLPAETKEKTVTVEKPIDFYGPATRQRVASWCSLMDVGKRWPEIVKLHKVNDLINKTEYIFDAPQWGKADYWATPYEILETNKGDCEDFSIAKYYTLRKLGVPESRLRFIYARSLKLNQAHMVLAYYPTPDAVPMILDSLDKDIKPATQRTDLLPVFSFNRQGLWISRREGDGKYLGSSTARLDHWKDLQHRMNDHERLMSYTHYRPVGDKPDVGMWRCQRVNGTRQSRLKD